MVCTTTEDSQDDSRKLDNKSVVISVTLDL